jgi:hypothetical protein
MRMRGMAADPALAAGILRESLGGMVELAAGLGAAKAIPAERHPQGLLLLVYKLVKYKFLCDDPLSSLSLTVLVISLSSLSLTVLVISLSSLSLTVLVISLSSFSLTVLVIPLSSFSLTVLMLPLSSLSLTVTMSLHLA